MVAARISSPAHSLKNFTADVTNACWLQSNVLNATFGLRGAAPVTKFIRLVIIVLSALIAWLPAHSVEENLLSLKLSAEVNTGDFRGAFTRLKRLEGSWDEAEYGRIVKYHLTGKGSALIEEFIGDPPMTSVYHLDGDNLRLTHYCNAGNQPRMVAALYTSDNLKFDFVDVTNLSAPNAYHTRTLAITFQDDNNVVLNFVGHKDGKEIATTHSLTRRNME
jgi:hypothetical protein